MRAKAHEYANRIHALAGLLELGMVDEAKQFLKSASVEHSQGSNLLVDRIGVPALAGLLVEKQAMAASVDTELHLDSDSELHMLPARLSELDAVTVAGNLIDNAIDAVATMALPRRRVEVGIFQEAHQVVIRVRDYGPGFEASLEELFWPGETSKRDHYGLGLPIVGEALVRAGGALDIECQTDGSVFEATFPQDCSPF